MPLSLILFSYTNLLLTLRAVSQGGSELLLSQSCEKTGSLSW